MSPDEPGTRADAAATTPPAARILIGVVCLLALGAVALSLRHLPGAMSWPFAVTWVATTLCGAFPLPLRRGEKGAASLSTVSVGIFFSLVRFGVAPTILVAATSAWAMTRVQTRTSGQRLRMVFNVAAIVVSAAAAGLTLEVAQPWDVPPLMAALIAAVCYFAVNSGLVAGVVSLATRTSFATVWQEIGLVAAPLFLIWALSGAIAATSLQEPHDAVVGVAILGTVFLTYRSITSHVAQLQDRSRVAEEASALNLRIAESLTMAISSPRGATYDELKDLQTYGRRTAAALGLGDEQQRELALAILLRDIGLLAVPRDVRGSSTPRTLSDAVRLKSHPALSTDMLADAGLPARVLSAIAAHHEHWDGTGYPAGLAGESIPLLARIVGALDFIEEAGHSAVHGPAGSPSEVCAQLATYAGSRFDPRVIEALVAAMSHEVTAVPAAIRVSASGPSEAARQTGVFRVISAVQRESRILDELALALQGPGSIDTAVHAVADALSGLVPVDTVEFVPPVGETAPAVSVRVTRRRADGTAAGAPRTGSDVPSHVTSSMATDLDDAGVPTGTLRIRAMPGAQFDAEHERVFGQVAALVARKVAADRLLHVAQRDASVDALTGLPNRRSLLLRGADDLANCTLAGLPLAVFVIDLDGFKTLNDTCGHALGDQALRAAADALRASIRPCDTAARLGGDEFVVLLPGCDGADALTRQQHLQERLCRLTVATPTGHVVLGASIGVALSPDDGRDLERLLGVADARMYEDKQRRRHVA